MKLFTPLCALLLVAGTGALCAQNATGTFKTKGREFALKYALVYTSDAKENYLGKDRVVITVHIVLSDKPLDAASLAGDKEPIRTMMRMATRGEVSYLDVQLDVDGKLKGIQWAPDFRTDLTWVGTDYQESALVLSARDKKHYSGRIHSVPEASQVDWVFDLKFDALMVPSGQ